MTDEYSTDPGHALHGPGPVGICTCHPSHGVLLPSTLGPVLSDSPCTPPSAFRGTEGMVFGVNNPGRLQGRKHQAVFWPLCPVICSSPGLIMGWRGLCPPPPPRRVGTCPGRASRRKKGGRFSEGHPAQGWQSHPQELLPQLLSCDSQLGGGSGRRGCRGLPGSAPRTAPSSPHGISSFRLCLVSVCCVVLSLCVGYMLCPPPPCPAPPRHCPGPQTIVRGSKGAKDGALTLLLDEFENMSVTRSNSLRKDSPPPPARVRQENGMPTEQATTARGGPEKAGSQGRVTRHSEAGGGSGDRRRVGPEKRPKSSREGSGVPQESARDKRPLSGPDVGTPQPPGLASGVKVAAGRPFNTYPRADTDHPSRGAQVTDLPAAGPHTVPFPETSSPVPHLPPPACAQPTVHLHPDHHVSVPQPGPPSCSGSTACLWPLQ